MAGIEEKGGLAQPYSSSVSSSQDRELSANGQRVAHKGFFGTLRHYEALLDKKFGIEAHGPERLLPEERDPENGKWSKQIVMALMWASGTMNLSCFITGFVGWELGLNLGQSIGITVLASFMGAALTGWCATMGPGTGLRQVSICRYSFGWWPAKIIAFLNVVEQVGWASVGCITGGLALDAVSGGAIGSIPGVVIIACIGLIFSVVGLRAVLTYEKYAWIAFFIIFMIIFGQVAPSASLAIPSAASGLSLTGAGLTLFAVVYGSSASWCSIVSDYYVQYPVDTSKWRIFFLTTAGVAIPTCIGMVAGCCAASVLAGNEELATIFDEQGAGYLLQVLLHPLGFAKFLLVILVLSSIGMNCIAMYSGALSLQQFARPLSVLPRFLWTLLLFTAIILVSIAGRDRILTVLQNFLSLLGYWNTTFFVIVAGEHYFFRGGLHGYQGYDLEAWNRREGSPVGYAGLFAFAAGIAGAVVGMSETYYVGPIAVMLKDGDLGNQLAFIFTAVAYLPARWAEKKWTGR